MASLSSCQGCSPAEGLDPSQGESSVSAHRAVECEMLLCGTWPPGMLGKLEWLGHVARMPDHRILKSVLFGWLPQARPRCGPRRRWKDVVHKDLNDIDACGGVRVVYRGYRRSRGG